MQKRKAGCQSLARSSASVGMIQKSSLFVFPAPPAILLFQHSLMISYAEKPEGIGCSRR